MTDEMSAQLIDALGIDEFELMQREAEMASADEREGEGEMDGYELTEGAADEDDEADPGDDLDEFDEDEEEDDEDPDEDEEDEMAAWRRGEISG